MANFTSKDNKIVSDMKECVRSFDLPINEFKPVKGSNIVFTSQARNDHFYSDIGVTYSKILKHVGIDVTLNINVPSEKMAEVWELLNLFNGRMPVYHYSIFQSLNSVSLRAILLVSEGCLPIGKFKRLLQEMLENTSLCFPLITELVEGANPEDLYNRFLEEDDDEGVKGESAISKEKANKILNDVKSVFADFKMLIEKRNRLDNGFVFNYWDQQMLDVPFGLQVLLFRKNKVVVLSFTPLFNVPDEKVPVIKELIGRISRVVGNEHLFFNRKTRQVNLIKGVLIDNGVLDRKEFKNSVLSLYSHGGIFLPIIMEQILSNKTPEDLEAKILEKAKGYPRL